MDGEWGWYLSFPPLFLFLKDEVEKVVVRGCHRILSSFYLNPGFVTWAWFSDIWVIDYKFMVE